MKSTVTISIEEYDELRAYRSIIKNKEAIIIHSCSRGVYTYYPVSDGEAEMLKKSTEIIKDLISVLAKEREEHDKIKKENVNLLCKRISDDVIIKSRKKIFGWL